MFAENWDKVESEYNDPEKDICNCGYNEFCEKCSFDDDGHVGEGEIEHEYTDEVVCPHYSFLL